MNDDLSNVTEEQFLNKEDYKKYVSMINQAYDEDDSLDTCVHSSFRVDGEVCHHSLQKIESDYPEQLLGSTFEYSEESKKELIIPSVVGYAKRNPLLGSDVTPTPKNNRSFDVNSYSNDGNVLTISNIDPRFAKEVMFNIEKIPPVLYKSHQKEKALVQTNPMAGFVGILELCLLTFAVTAFVGIVLALEIMS